VGAFESAGIREVVIVAGACMAAALVGAIALLVVAARQISEIDIPENADFFETMQHLPITVPLALDLLDMAFDIFAAPIAWLVLELLGLQSLQLITVVEGVIPGTQLIPTLTMAWIISRMMKKRQTQSYARSALDELQRRDRSVRYSQLRSGSSIADEYRRQALPAPGSEPRSFSLDDDILDDDIVDGELLSEEEKYEEDFEDFLPPGGIRDEDW
jgi:hypothetical protein